MAISKELNYLVPHVIREQVYLHDKDTNPLITRLLINISPTEVFEQMAGNIHIENNGQSGDDGTVRGKEEYLMRKNRSFLELSQKM